MQAVVEETPQFTVVKSPMPGVVPPMVGGVVKAVVKSALIIPLNAPTPATAVACSTCVVVVSEFAPTMYSAVNGKVSVTPDAGAGKFNVVVLVVPKTN